MQSLKIFPRLLLGLFCVMFFSIPVQLWAAGSSTSVNISFTQPSAEERTIAPERSFYVGGSLSGDVGNITAVEVTLAEKNTGRVVRTIRSGYTNMKIAPGFPTVFDGDPTTFGMPELLWDGSSEPTVFNGDGKCIFNASDFTALIPNSTDDNLNLKDGNGQAYAPLQEGAYTLTAQAFDSVDLLGSASMDITIGVTPNKMLFRFSPAEHKNRGLALAKEKGFRVYEDCFPGYWSFDGNFCEIQSEWRAADAAEYKEGNVHFLIYNVKKSSATYSVELATLQTTNGIDTRLTNYYYQYGEPSLKVKGSSLDSPILKFKSGDKLQFTRAEINAPGKENTLEQDAAKAQDYDLNLSDGVTVQAGETLSLYGVAAPIQIDESHVVELNPGTYTGKAHTLNNKLATLDYRITGDGVDQSYSKAVSLDRISGGWSNPSELEYRHDLPVTNNMKGKSLSVQVSGYDAYGNPVPGTKEIISLKVKKESPWPADPTTPTGFNDANSSEKASSPAATGDDSSLLLPILLLLLSGCTVSVVLLGRKQP